MSKKLSISSAIINLIIAAFLIAVAIFCLVMLITVAADIGNIGWGFIAGILAIPFLGFGVAVFACAGAGFAFVGISGLIAIKKNDGLKQKTVAKTCVMLSAALTGFCAILVLSLIGEALTSANGGNFSLLLYALIPLAVSAANMILNVITLKSLKNNSKGEKAYEQ